MSPEQLLDLSRRCEDSSKLDEYLTYAKAQNPIVGKLAGLKAARGWSDQHFLAICTVCLVAAMEPVVQPQGP